MTDSPFPSLTVPQSFDLWGEVARNDAAYRRKYGDLPMGALWVPTFKSGWHPKRKRRKKRRAIKPKP